MNLGLLPINIYHLLFPLIALLIWGVFYRFGRKRNILEFYNSALAVSFWEEILFRGIVLGLLLKWTNSEVWSIIVSSVLFGLFHLRNYWWASRRQLLSMVLFSTLIAGPIFAITRIHTGDIYLGILLHWLANFFAIFPNWHLGTGTGFPIPKDDFLKEKRKARRRMKL